MITVSMPKPTVHLVGGTPEEWQLFAQSLTGYLGHPVEFHATAEGLGKQWGRFHDALDHMHKDQAPLAVEMVRGMDSMAGLL